MFVLSEVKCVVSRQFALYRGEKRERVCVRDRPDLRRVVREFRVLLIRDA